MMVQEFWEGVGKLATVLSSKPSMTFLSFSCYLPFIIPFIALQHLMQIKLFMPELVTFHTPVSSRAYFKRHPP